MPPEEQHPDRPKGVNTWLVIPYFDGDVGRKGIERPVPAEKGVSWLCPSIFVDGKPGNTAFRRGVPLRVALAVANWGAGILPAAALVRLWWSDPTLAFATATAIGQTTLIVPPGSAPVRTGDFLVTIPEGASPHVCLLAQVSAPLDGAANVPDPHSDRHWAQLNLVEVSTVATDGTVVLPVLVANPFPEPRRSAVAIESMLQEHAEQLGRQRGQDIRAGAAAEMEVHDAEGEDGRLTELGPHETRRVEVTLRLSDPPQHGAPQGFVLSQRLIAQDEETELTGTLGILVAPN